MNSPKMHAPIHCFIPPPRHPQIKYSKMPGTGPVYQPTTVSYETRPGLLAQTAATVQSPLVWLRRPVPQTLLLVCALAAIAGGIAMIVNGAADYEDTEEHRAELAAMAAAGSVSSIPFQTSIASSDESTALDAAVDAEKADAAAAAAAEAAAAEAAGETVDVVLVVAGVILTAVGFILAGLYVKVAEWRRSYVCPCGLSKKHQGLARQMQQDSVGGNGLGASSVSGGGGQIMAMNPSTDPLVSHTQYAPVSELPRPEDEECRTLMLDTNKEWYVDTKTT